MSTGGACHQIVTSKNKSFEGVIGLARLVRTWFPGAKFHVTSRGNRRSPLFFDEWDYEKYLGLLKETMEKYPFVVHSYCLMTNHTHLQIQTLDTPLSSIMKYLNTKYAKYFNKKYDFTGHVFEKRYRDELITNLDYEIDLSKYIHLNPVSAGMVPAPEDYRWSSYRAYVYGENIPLIDPQPILSYFPDPQAQNYEQYMKVRPPKRLIWKDFKLYIVDETEEQPCGLK